MFCFDIGYSFFGSSNTSNCNSFIPNTSKGGAFLAVGAGMRIHVNKIISFVWDSGLSFQNIKGQG